MSKYLDFAVGVAEKVGDGVLKENYGKMQRLPAEWTTKQHFRTLVDTLSDAIIRNRIRETFPEHSIFSEEDKDLVNDSQYSWVVDPLDGTIPYRFGITDHFSVCISLASKQIPIVGVIYAPNRGAHGELYYAEKGAGAFCNGNKISVSTEENINHVIMGFDSGKETKSFKRTDLAKYVERLYTPDGVSCLVCSGCASVPLALTASGRLHAYAGLSLEPWDMAAAVAINREAGAKVTNLKGEEWNLNEPSIVVANPVLHEKILKLINS